MMIEIVPSRETKIPQIQEIVKVDSINQIILLHKHQEFMKPINQKFMADIKSINQSMIQMLVHARKQSMCQASAHPTWRQYLVLSKLLGITHSQLVSNLVSSIQLGTTRNLLVSRQNVSISKKLVLLVFICNKPSLQDCSQDMQVPHFEKDSVGAIDCNCSELSSLIEAHCNSACEWECPCKPGPDSRRFWLMQHKHGQQQMWLPTNRAPRAFASPPHAYVVFRGPSLM